MTKKNKRLSSIFVCLFYQVIHVYRNCYNNVVIFLYLFVCQSVCHSVCLSVCPSVCLSVCLSVRLSVRLSVIRANINTLSYGDWFIAINPWLYDQTLQTVNQELRIQVTFKIYLKSRVSQLQHFRWSCRLHWLLFPFPRRRWIIRFRDSFLWRCLGNRRSSFL